MKDWKDDPYLRELAEALKANVARMEARVDAERKALAREGQRWTVSVWVNPNSEALKVKPWDHEKDGHRWICIASGHGVETCECSECGIVKDFEV